jgi:GR25 family glycosyltransferase involved in LPS biosynthesis
MNWRESYISFINLDSRKDRLSHMTNELNRVGLSAVRTKGILPKEVIIKKYKTQVMQDRGSGAIGCHFSQVKVMQDALKQNKDAIVLEDDLIFTSDIKERLDYIQTFCSNNEWDVFFLGGTVHLYEPAWHGKKHSEDLKMCHCKLECDAEETETKYIYRTYGMFSTHAYIVNKNSIEKILKYFDNNIHLSMGIDWLFIKMQPELKAYCFLPGSVKQMDSQSNIGLGISEFSNFKFLGTHWWAEDKDIKLKRYIAPPTTISFNQQQHKREDSEYDTGNNFFADLHAGRVDAHGNKTKRK